MKKKNIVVDDPDFLCYQSDVEGISVYSEIEFNSLEVGYLVITVNGSCEQLVGHDGLKTRIAFEMKNHYETIIEEAKEVGFKKLLCYPFEDPAYDHRVSILKRLDWVENEDKEFVLDLERYLTNW